MVMNLMASALRTGFSLILGERSSGRTCIELHIEEEKERI